MDSGGYGTTSLSKGCFVIRPSSPRKRKLDERYDCFPEVQGESNEHRRLRYDLYTETWKGVQEQVSVLQAELNGKVFGKLVEYIKKSGSLEKTSTVKNEIPTGVFITGVNMPDHDVIFSELVKELSNVTPYVARLCSKNSQNLKTIIKEVTNQITEAIDHVDEILEIDVSKFTHRKPNMTMAMFAQWYAVLEGAQVEADAGAGPMDKRPVVLIFEDFESFQPKALQDFITICSLYVNQLPIFLLFGVATIPAVVHQLLPRSVSSCLCIEKFHAQPAITYLLEAIDRILITPEFSFKLGPMVFQYLYENFLFHDFSLQNFISGLKFCMMDHFYSNPLSILCSSRAGRSTRKLSHEQLEIVRKCSSFQKFVEQQDPKNVCLLLANDKHTMAIVSKIVDDMYAYHQFFFPVVRCLHALVGKLPGYPMGKKCRDVYECCLKVNVKNLDSYHQSMKMAAFLAKDELVPVLEQCVELLSSAFEKNGELFEAFSQFLDPIKKTLVNFNEISKQNREVTPAVKSAEVSLNKNPTMKSRFELQEKLKNAINSKKKVSSYEKHRANVIANLDRMFQKYLLCPSEQTLHEIFYYDAIDTVKPRLSGCPRVSIQTALNNPRYYLKCPCCDIEPGAIQDTLPDISVAFKLHLECGRLINLYDWLEAFLSVTEPAVSQSGKKKKTNMGQELQARFIQAVSELQFLGFIKATKRKTDHVARLTWGNC